MAEYNIEETSFEEEKNKLKVLSEETTTVKRIDKVNTDGGWSDFWSGGIPSVLSGHKVTGEEFNGLVSQLQNIFLEINDRDRTFIREFRQVYETFEALDKEYVQGILVGIKRAEEAKQEVNGVKKEIYKIRNIVQKVVYKLKEFSKKDEDENEDYEDDIEFYKNETSRLEKRINRAYIIAGSAIGISVIQMLLLITGVL